MDSYQACCNWTLSGPDHSLTLRTRRTQPDTNPNKLSQNTLTFVTYYKHKLNNMGHGTEGREMHIYNAFGPSCKSRVGVRK